MRTIEVDLRLRIGRADAEISRLTERIAAARKYETQRAAVKAERAKLCAMLDLETGGPTMFPVESDMDAGAQILADNEAGEVTEVLA